MIPVSDLIIEGETTVGAITTVEACDEAMIQLKIIMDNIREQMIEHGQKADPEWSRRARVSLSLKGAAYMALTHKRRNFREGSNNRWLNFLLQHIRQEVGVDRFVSMEVAAKINFGQEFA